MSPVLMDEQTKAERGCAVLRVTQSGREWAPGRQAAAGSGPLSTPRGSQLSARLTRGSQGPEQQERACGRPSPAPNSPIRSDTSLLPRISVADSPEPRGDQSLTLQCESAPPGGLLGGLREAKSGLPGGGGSKFSAGALGGFGGGAVTGSCGGLRAPGTWGSGVRRTRRTRDRRDATGPTLWLPGRAPRPSQPERFSRQRRRQAPRGPS